MKVQRGAENEGDSCLLDLRQIIKIEGQLRLDKAELKRHVCILYRAKGSIVTVAV
jgi:hypothetical protein